ncbi:hypothetical protein HZH68_000522 [Vespula germanica]|uniref:THAP-type domain-containing protein n=1 Tax=Vespula germanica TaxID=30212 RepID=A0A834NTR6_VESGE|nr:hypothetical protein HZH68_000522 [Vespula germanica]
MVLSCLVCKLKINTADKSVSFHKFPKNENTKTKWLQVLDIADIKPSSRICSHHFKAEDFTLGTLNLKLRLKWTAIPSINLKRNLQTDLSNVQTNDVSKSSVEAKMCLEVAMEEIKEQGHKIRQLKKKVNRLESVVCDLRSLIKELKYKKFLSKSNDTLSEPSLDESGDEFNNIGEIK